MNVIICEADPASAEALRQAVAAWVCGRQLEHAVSVTVFHSSEDLMERFEAGLRMDALLTGLQFQHEESGLRAARVIHRLDPNLPVVLISNSAEYVYEGYAVSALRFLKKPVSQQDIDECMELVWRRYLLSRRDSVLIETRAQTLRLPADSILSIEALGHNVQIKTTDEVGEYTLRKRFHEIQRLLPPDAFVRCHRSYIVHLRYVRRCTPQNVLLSNGDLIPVGRTFRAEFHRRFRAWCREEDATPRRS